MRRIFSIIRERVNFSSGNLLNGADGTDFLTIRPWNTWIKTPLQPTSNTNPTWSPTIETPSPTSNWTKSKSIITFWNPAHSTKSQFPGPSPTLKIPKKSKIWPRTQISRQNVKNLFYTWFHSTTKRKKIWRKLGLFRMWAQSLKKRFLEISV